MLIILHIAFALTSFVSMGAALLGKFYDRRRNFGFLLKISSGSLVGLLLSGAALVLFEHASLSSACVSGLASLLALAIAYSAYRRLAVIPVKSK